MLMTKSNLDIWYNDYKKQFNASVKNAKSRGGSTRGIKPLSRAEFGIDFTSEAFDNPKLSGKQLAQKMAKHDVYKVSGKQARAFAEAHIKKYGGELTPQLIMQYRLETVSGNNIFEEIKLTSKILKDSGLSSYNVNILIGQQFFGSE